MESEQLIELTADIVAAHVSNNEVTLDDVPGLIREVHSALAKANDPAVAAQEKTPVVSVRSSIKPDYLVCLECGSKQKMLKRHLQTAHGTTPAEYRSAYGLPHDYPMSAPNYSETRRGLAKLIGLGRKKVMAAITGEGAPSAPAEEAASEAKPTKAPRKRSTLALRTKKPAKSAAE